MLRRHARAVVAGRFPEDIILRCAKKPGLRPARMLGPGSLRPSPPSLALWAPLRAYPGALARVGSVSAVNTCPCRNSGDEPVPTDEPCAGRCQPTALHPAKKVSQISYVGGGFRHPEFLGAHVSGIVVPGKPRVVHTRAFPATTPGILLAHSAFPGSMSPVFPPPPERKPEA